MNWLKRLVEALSLKAEIVALRIERDRLKAEAETWFDVLEYERERAAEYRREKP